MVAPAVEDIDLFKIVGRSISGWIPSLKTGHAGPVRQPFCSRLEERLLLWLEYNPQVACYVRGDIGTRFATTYRLPIPKVMYNPNSLFDLLKSYSCTFNEVVKRFLIETVYAPLSTRFCGAHR